MTPLTVCICTVRRPDGLRNLFGSLQRLETAPDFDLRFCVIDDDDTPSSQALVAELSASLPWPVRYVHEPEPGIPAARNAAIRAAGPHGYLVFVDDDETVAPDWLVQLWAMEKASHATFVQGPCEMTVRDPTQAWWLDTVFFSQRTYPDGAARHESWSNNVLIDLDFVTRHACRFDSALRFDGGSDTLFFQDIIRKGGKGTYAAKAKVFEEQPANRLTWRWALRRQFRYGVTRANTSLLRLPRWKAIPYCLVRGAAMLGVGALLSLTVLYRGKRGLANAGALLARGCGVLLGAAGVHRLEYAR